MNATRLLGLLLATMCAALTAAAQSFSPSRSVLDSSGRTVSGGAFGGAGASGQPGGVGPAAGGALVSEPGFFSTLALRPALDTDGDGTANELDPDNDNDGLSDRTELAGSAFDPATRTDVNNADSDGDEARDGAEAAAGTDPGSAASRLAITAAQRSGTGLQIDWAARSNRTYRVRYDGDLADGRPFTGVVATVTARAPAPPPWYAMTARVTATNPPSVRVKSYRVEAVVP